MNGVLRFALIFTLLTSCVFSPKSKRYPQAEMSSSTTIDGDGAVLLKYDSRYELGIQQFVKFIVFLDKDQIPKNIIFQNTNLFAFHSDYLLTRSEFSGWSRAQIDEVSLKSGPNRKMILGTVFSHYFDDPVLGNNVKTSFEIVSSELTDIKTVKSIHQLLANSSPEMLNSKYLAYLATGSFRNQILQQKDELAQEGIITLDLFKNKKRQVYVKGWTVGKVLMAKAQDLSQLIQDQKVNSQTILILDEAPREIPPVAGLIIAQPTAPSSHINLLAEMFQIPFTYDKDAFKSYQNVSDKLVYYRADSLQEVVVSLISENTHKRLWAVKVPKPLKFEINANQKPIVKVDQLKEEDVSAYGGKSTRLGLIRREVPEHTVSTALGIPIYYFRQFLNQGVMPNGQSLATFVDEKLKSITPQMSYSETVAILDVVRKAIKSTQIAPDLLNEIHLQLKAFFPNPSQRLKLRSSANVEDGQEFNGAGLYDSEGVWLTGAPVGKENDLEKGLNKVWRSIYSDRGYLARSAFGVSEQNAAMGVLVHEPFKNEIANGVSLYIPSTDQFTSDSLVITGFPGEDSTVTNPNGKDQPEVIKATKAFNGGWVMQTEQSSTLLPVGQTLMQHEEYSKLADIMQKIADKWPGGKPTAGLDFEWKLMQNGQQRHVVIKQVRPLPAKRKEQLKDGSNFFILGETLQELEIGYPESNAAFAQHFCPEKIAIEMPSMSEMDLQKSVMIPRVRFTLRNKKYEYMQVGATVQTHPNDKYTKFTLGFNLASDLSKEHRFFVTNLYKNSDFIYDKISTSISPGETDINPVKPFFQKIDSYSCVARSPQFLDVSSELNMEDLKISHTIKFKNGNEGAVQFEGFYKLQSGFDKTAHYIITKTVFTGFGLKKPATISVPRGAVYAGEHHNFGWGFSADLMASDMSKEDYAMFTKAYGRYMLLDFSDLQQVAWLKPNGKLSDKVKVTMD
ncbi:MAG: PEP/pyruvate-binding domain-containing protein [Bdellovibrionota bacterium]